MPPIAAMTLTLIPRAEVQGPLLLHFTKHQGWGGVEKINIEIFGDLNTLPYRMYRFYSIRVSLFFKASSSAGCPQFQLFSLCTIQPMNNHQT